MDTDGKGDEAIEISKCAISTHPLIIPCVCDSTCLREESIIATSSPVLTRAPILPSRQHPPSIPRHLYFGTVFESCFRTVIISSSASREPELIPPSYASRARSSNASLACNHGILTLAVIKWRWQRYATGCACARGVTEQWMPAAQSSCRGSRGSQ